jgi:hypothetical protein
MFHQSYQQLPFQQQIIAISQTYPCPRCCVGILEPFGHTETFKCNGCERSFVPLCGARLLHPSKRMGAKIAPTFWWDGLRWHWAGTTVTTKQLLAMAVLSITPVLLLNCLLVLNIWRGRPEWLSPLVLTALVGLATMQMIYLICWDFDFLSRRRTKQ